MPHHGGVESESLQEPAPVESGSRLRHSIGDMVRSLAVVLGIVAVILILTHRAQPDPVKVVDPQPVLAVARMQADFPVVMPEAVAGLRPTSVRWEPTPKSDGQPVWHVGFLTGEGEYVQVSQSTASDPAFIAEQTVDARPDGTVAVGGQTWQIWRGANRTSLVLGSSDVTTIVSGTVDDASLMRFAASLRDG